MDALIKWRSQSFPCPSYPAGKWKPEVNVKLRLLDLHLVIKT